MKRMLSLIIGILTLTVSLSAQQLIPSVPMSQARFNHATVLLNDGRVLVCGGGTNGLSNVLKSTEIYDPISNTWTTAADMNSKRADFTATVLRDGRVLVCGGYNGSGCNDSAEIYDPISNAWTMVTPMAHVRYDHSAILMQDGRVLVVGQYSSVGACNPDNGDQFGEVYDPVSNIWTPTQMLSSGRSRTTLTLLPNGNVLLIGGRCEGGLCTMGNYSSECLLLNPATLTWSVAGSLLNPRGIHQAFLMNNNKVLILGGENAGGVLNTTEIYDITGNSWSAGPSMTTIRRQSGSILLPNNEIAVFGGLQSTGGAGPRTDVIEVYNPTSNSWTTSPLILPATWSSSSAINLHNGRVLLAGGFNDNSGTGVVDCFVYDHSNLTGNTLAASAIATDKNNYTQTLLPNGNLLVAGGGQSSISNGSNTCSLYNASSNTWSATSNMSTNRINHTTNLMVNGNVMTIGGNDGASVHNSCEFYNYSSGNWSTAPAMNQSRTNHASILLMDGRILTSGGFDGTSILTTCEIYDPQLNTWISLAPMNTPRSNHKMILLKNGKVLAMGGTNGTNTVATAELYDPCNDSWTPTSNSMVTAVMSFSAQMLENGNILVSGGFINLSGNATATGQIYNPVTDTWTATAGNMTSARGEMSSALMHNGKVVIIGGRNLNTWVGQIEIYDPIKNSYDVSANLITNKTNHRVSLLSNNLVLIGPGQISSGPAYSSQVELFDPFTSSLITQIPSIGTIAPASLTITIPSSSGNAIVQINGTGFRDDRYNPSVTGCGASGSGQSTDNSPQNHPVVMITRIGENDHGTSFQRTLPYNIHNSMFGTTNDWSNLFTEILFPLGSSGNRELPAGVYQMRVVVNGVPSHGETFILEYDYPTDMLLTDVNTCDGNNVTLTAQNASQYLWSTGATTPSINFVATQTDTITVKGCIEYTLMLDTSIVIVNPLPVVISGNNGPVCTGSSLDLNASGGVSYTWAGPSAYSSNLQNPSINPVALSNAGIYTVTATDNNGCSNTSTTNVVLIPGLIVIASNSGPVCEGSMISLFSGGGGTYTWSGPGGYTSSQQNPILNPASSTQSGIYTVTSQDVNGCTGTATTNIQIDSNPVIAFTGDSTLCDGEQTIITANGGITYLWNTGDNTPDIFISPSATTTYSVTVTDANGCVSSQTVNISVNPLPVVSLTGDTIACIGSEITLTVSGGSGFLWQNGETNGTITIPANENDTVISVVISNGSCQVSDSITIHLANDMSTLYIPNVFTPNSDGLNDAFTVGYTGLGEFQGYIFDRWGVELYSWNKPDGGWDGIHNDQIVPEGVYVYLIKATNGCGKQQEHAGMVTVLR